MKPTRIFATAALVVSSFCLITAASISVGDEPGVVRMAPRSGNGVPTPQPDSTGSGVVRMTSSPIAQEPVQAQPGQSGPVMEQGLYPQPGQYAPYFERSYSATEVAPNVFYQPVQPFGPIIESQTNIGGGLGFEEGSQRFSARLPYHIVPNTNVFLTDIQAAVTFDGRPIASVGGIYRNYDEVRDRIFGWNVYGDYDEGFGFGEWTRLTAGFESLGRYIDFRANGYLMVGSDTALISSSLSPNLTLAGSSIFKARTETRENAYSGGNIEVGGPVPFLGRHGVNLYAGPYYVGHDLGEESVGIQARVEALITESLTVNTYYTNDDTFDQNTWVSISYQLPNYRNRSILRARESVRDRLQDPVVRNSRIQTRIDTPVFFEQQINAASGLAWSLVHVDPNRTAAGNGTFEDPFGTMQAAAVANNAGVDIIRVRPRTDDTGTNLTVPGGLTLFDDQILLSSLKPFTIAPDCIIPAETTTSDLGPLISNPNMVAGGSVINLADNNQIIGMRINAANAAGTVFGNGVSNALPITDVNLTCNVFTNYTTGANLQDVSGRVVIDENTFDGLLGASNNGLDLSIAGGATANVLVLDNQANENSGVGLNIVANVGSTLNADNPNGTVPTGILNNTATGNGTGIAVVAQAGAEVNAVVEGNTATDNTFDGLRMTTDGGTFNLASLAGNTFNDNLNNGTFIHYLNGGIFNATSEDLDGDGVLDAGEDVNGNGDLDFGIVSNNMNGNFIAGLCIIGEDASVGTFDIGGPNPLLGNTFNGNAEGGVLVDLKDTATAQVDALFNQVTGGNSTPGLTIVLDFIDPGQASEVDISGFNVGTFDVTAWGFNQSQYNTVTNAVLQTLNSYYKSLPTVADDARSIIPVGQELNIDFVIGDTGVAPSNGATEYYVLTIGDSTDAPAGLAGLAGDIGNVRNAQGQGPGQGLSGVTQGIGQSAAGIYTNNIVDLSPFLNPPNAFLGPNGGTRVNPSGSADYAIRALTSGDLTFTRRALGLITAHELGHTLSLRHIQATGAVTPTGLLPIMGTPAIDTPIQVLVQEAEFAFSGTNPGEIAGEAPFVQNDISQLVSAIGLRSTAASTRNGVRVNATDNARLLESTFNNNTITGASQDGIAILMNDSAVAESVTIQGNTITDGGGNGIRLVADGPNAEIHADNTVGGVGVNVYNGTSFTRGNTISRNGGDGFRAMAANGGLVNGNLINNTITDNGGNGAALMVDNGGTVDFGTVANNRVIRGNTITGNGGAGLLLNQLTSPITEAEINATVLGNTLSNNDGGGIVSTLSGPNNAPPALPAIIDNNRLNLVVGGTAATDVNTIDGNGNVGIGVNVTGNGLANVAIENTNITGTTAGGNPLFNGSGIDLRRADSSLLTATIDNVSSTGNAGDGLRVRTVGSDKTDPNQPNSGTPNTVTVADSNFSANTGNGASYLAQADSTLISDVSRSTFSNNGGDGILINTTQDASFGDPTIGLPPGRRSVFDGIVVDSNGGNGVEVNATDNSRALLQITSTAAPLAVGSHGAASARGNTTISNNGGSGVLINTDGGQSDVLVTSNTAITTISGNGTNGGGNGVELNASGDSNATVRVTRTQINTSIAGASEDTNANGVLDAGEDLNNNGDIDVADGDGIQANFTGNTVSTLVVGNVGEGNVIQSNGDDGIAITADNSNDATAITRPVISIVDNVIGGTLDGLPAGNGGDGVSLNVFGRTAAGFAPAAINTDLNAGPLTFNDGVTASGAIPQLTMTGNTVTNNDRRGVNVLMTGAGGTRNRENGNSTFDPILITLNDNNISSNGMEGVFVRADAQMNQSRFRYLANFPFPNPPFNPADDRPTFPAFYNPLLPEFTNLNIGSVNGNTAYTEPYLNLRTVQNSFLTITNNTIQNNGTATVTGEGLHINVGTGAYLAADVQNNAFGGNLEEDFRTDSFLSFGETFTSVNDTGNLTFDAVYLDDTAQFDLRFQDNGGNQILPSDFGAVYTQLDPLKAAFLGVVGASNRDASLFQVDNGPNLNNPNNAFINFGITQDIQAAFTNGNYNIRGAADPLFPNIGFAPFLP